MGIHEVEQMSSSTTKSDAAVYTDIVSQEQLVYHIPSS